jgi:alcohol dehydrogenase class IV
MKEFETAQALLRQFKGDRYINGMNILSILGPSVARLGRRAVLIRDCFPGSEGYIKAIKDSLKSAGVEIVAEMDGAAPNAPRQDLARITSGLNNLAYDVVVSFGGGSTIDAAKAGEVLRTLGGSIENYFGTGLVTQALMQSGKKLTPHVAIQTAASSGAHLTKYSNITDTQTSQKKLIVDLAIVPTLSVFDYAVTCGAPISLTADGALDGISHALEVMYSAVGKPEYETTAQVADACIRLVVNYLPIVLADPRNPDARQALGLATDLGGYAIMIGGTNGAHLTSFSLVDILSHGRACGMLNPYYTVFFAPEVQQPLKLVGEIYKHAGYADASVTQLSGRDLGIAVAEAMIALEKKIGFPTKLEDVPGFTDAHIERALTAAKDPQLKMKLENMPVALRADQVDEYMGPILRAAKTGNLSLIKNL